MPAGARRARRQWWAPRAGRPAGLRSGTSTGRKRCRSSCASTPLKARRCIPTITAPSGTWQATSTRRSSIRSASMLTAWAHTNGMVSFWASLKRGYYGIHHHISRKHLQRYVTEFAGRHNCCRLDTGDQLRHVAKAFKGKQLRYNDLRYGG